MTNPINDKNLVYFLKQYRPILPEEQPDLEQDIMAAIEEDRSTASRDRDKISNRLLLSRFAKSRANFVNRLWIYTSAMTASLLVAWSGYQTLAPAKITSSEEAHLEAFLINNWEGAADNSNWLPLSFPSDN